MRTVDGHWSAMRLAHAGDGQWLSVSVVVPSLGREIDQYSEEYGSHDDRGNIPIR